LPQGFATRDPLSFDIRNLSDFKLYRIRQTYDANFGTLAGNTAGGFTSVSDGAVSHADLINATDRFIALN